MAHPAYRRPDALVFDMDGLMLDTERINRTSWQLAAAALGFEVDDAFYATFVGRRNADCERDVLARFGDAFPLADFRRGYDAARGRIVAERGLPHKPGVVELISCARDHGLAVAVATSSGRRTAEHSLGLAGLAEHFTIIVSGDQVARGKPEPDIYLEAAARLGIEPTRCVALEDSNAGILSASRAGMCAVLVPDLGVPSDEARAAAFAEVTTLHDVIPLLTDWLTRVDSR